MERFRIWTAEPFPAGEHRLDDLRGAAGAAGPARVNGRGRRTWMPLPGPWRGAALRALPLAHALLRTLGQVHQ